MTLTGQYNRCYFIFYVLCCIDIEQKQTDRAILNRTVPQHNWRVRMKQFATQATSILFALILSTGLLTAQDVVLDRGDLSSGLSHLQTPSMLKGGPGSVLAQWSTGTSLPEGKRAHTVASHNGFVYIFGGASGNQWSPPR